MVRRGAFITKCTAQLMRDLGSTQSPQNAFMLNLGLESLHVRMPRHCENGQAVAEFLQQHPKIAWVSYCGLPGDKYHKLGGEVFAQRFLRRGVLWREGRTCGSGDLYEAPEAGGHRDPCGRCHAPAA